MFETFSISFPLENSRKICIWNANKVVLSQSTPVIAISSTLTLSLFLLLVALCYLFSFYNAILLQWKVANTTHWLLWKHVQLQGSISSKQKSKRYELKVFVLIQDWYVVVCSMKYERRMDKWHSNSKNRWSLFKWLHGLHKIGINFGIVSNVYYYEQSAVCNVQRAANKEYIGLKLHLNIKLYVFDRWYWYTRFMFIHYKRWQRNVLNIKLCK